MKKFKLSQQKYQDLKKELEYLKCVKEKEVAEQIKAARGFGDLSENSEYDEAKNEQGKLYARVLEIESILANNEIIDEVTDTNEIRTGNKVVVEFVGDGYREEFHLVGSQEVDLANNRISDESPFGKSLIGLKVGDIAVVEAPAGQMQYKVVEIRL